MPNAPSTTATDEPVDRHSVTVTVVLTALMVALFLAVAFKERGALRRLEHPVATTIAFHEQALTLAEVSGDGAWPRVRRWAMDLPDHPLESAASAYRVALDHTEGVPGRALALRARRAVVLALLGQRQAAREELAAASGLATPASAALVQSIDYALLSGPLVPAPQDFTRALSALAVDGIGEQGFTADKLSLALHSRSGQTVAASADRERFERRAARLRGQADMVAGSYALLLGWGVLVAAVALIRRRPIFPMVAQAPLPPPWSLERGYAVALRGACLLMIVGGGTEALADVLGAGDLALGTLTGTVILCLYVRRQLLRPTGLSAGQAFGAPPRRSWRALLGSVGALIALEQTLSALASTGSQVLGGRMPWTELINEQALLGGSGQVLATAAEVVIAAPLIEELLFRGIIYAGLRRRLEPLPSALLSAGLFAVVHGYSSLGTVTVFLGAVAWALVYERCRSLVPCLTAHATNNALALASDLALR